uniref:Ciliary neurotrophic factor n=1 Tax=Denticeps clupeoides TaxID=299321 RepID=A0AAY4DFA1_9TELE
MEGPSDAGVPGRSAAAKALDLARLLHGECARLLDLFRERESFPADHDPEGGRLVSLGRWSDDMSAAEQVWHHRCALRKCLGLLELLIAREEEEEMGGGDEGEYEAVRRAVRERLGHLLFSTAALLDDGDDVGDLSPQHDCAEGRDEVEGSGSFAMKLWMYKVLLELIHWTGSTSKVLCELHSEREAKQEQTDL